jgi:hypothetical protein
VPPKTVALTIQFASPVSLDVAAAPFDVYIERAGVPGHQIHQPQYAGTSSMNAALFGTIDDGSTATRHFVDTDGLPFALNIPQIIDYPQETIAIDQVYPDISAFASSAGTQHADWFLTNEVKAKAFTGGANGTGVPQPVFLGSNSPCGAPPPPPADGGVSNDAGADGSDDAFADVSSDVVEGGSSDATTAEAGFPAPPTLGTTLVDRVGRPFINQAVTDPFDMPSITPGGTMTEDALKDDYNSVGDPTAWASRYTNVLAGSLKYWDAFDGVCGNQLLAGSGPSSRYTPLASLLADDQLFLDTTRTSCQTYFAVELNAAGITSNADCGGRTPLEDAADATYTFLATGASGLGSGGTYSVGDGVAADADNAPNLATFPFLGAPNP